MKLLKLTVWVCFCLYALILLSCTKAEPTIEDSSNMEKESLTKVRLPVKIVYGRLTTVYEYFPNTARLKEIRKSTGYRYVFAYDQQERLLEYQIYHNERFSSFAQIAWNAGGKISKIVKFDVEPVYQKTYFPRGQYTIVVDTNGLLTKISDYGADKKLIDEQTLSYDDQGNIKQIQTASGDASSAALLTYDSKKGIFKNLANMQLIFVLHQDIEMLGTDNNVLRYLDFGRPEEEREITYEYNSDGYPTIMNVNRRSWKESHLITYEEFNLP